MSRSLGNALPPDLLARLSQADLARHLGRVLPLMTVDGEGRPHPMLLSALEVRSSTPETIRIVIGANSQSARNLLERQAATLLLVEPERAVYVKARATDGPRALSQFPNLVLFTLRVEEVLEDSPAEWEGAMRITAPLCYAPVPALDAPRTRATLEALAHGSAG